MKIKLRYLFFLALPLGLIFSCQKEENLDDRTFYCKIDGEEFYPNAFPGGVFSFSSVRANYYPKENRFGMLVLNKTDGADLALAVVGFTHNDSVEVIEYTDYRNSDGCIGYQNLFNDNLWVKFESVDSTTGIIKMKFQGDLINQCGDTVEVREGHLNKVATWNF